ncbi:hypothetical protein OG401_20980 [Kitasatospora purpeofusca]|uniref:hypothetical protein n=1 Tax=Kitasatospora purpeofusca TaxID=67352 RepID=UPI00224D4CD7|nr:hypothetical protein [Kitasatospora purpeofusca]MCX4686755.1 hypothetical protein [Kitasatospora purpeofusca]
MPTTSKPFLLDITERAGATAAEAGLAYAIVELSDRPGWWVPVLIPALAVLKGWAAGFVGRPKTGSLLPARHDPASRR